MKSREFAYWLQGAFELSDTSEVDATQTQIIKNHLAMVKYHEKEKMGPFCVWLNGFLEIAEPRSLNVAQTTKIKDKLNDIFEHVVIPKN